MQAKLVALGLAGLAAGGVAVWVAGDAGADRPQIPSAPLTLLVGWSLIGSGLLSWRARPGNRVGPIMVATGFLWFGSVLQDAHEPVPFTLGFVLQVVWIAGFVYLTLAFPSGRLRGRFDLALVVVAFGLVTIVQLGWLLVADSHAVICARCSTNLLEIGRSDSLANGLLQFQRVAGLAVIVGGIAVLIRRWRRASRPERRAVAPVLVAGGVAFAALTASIVADVFSLPNGDLYGRLSYYAFAAVPVAVLLVFLQRRLARGAVAGLVVELGEPSSSLDLQHALSRALGDPSLEFAFWVPAAGAMLMQGRRSRCRSRGRPAVDRRRARRPADRGADPRRCARGQCRVGGICVCRGRVDARELAASSRAAASLTELGPGRLVEATDAERRRIERDLHDGTQQRSSRWRWRWGCSSRNCRRAPRRAGRSRTRPARRLRRRSRNCVSSPRYPSEDPGRTGAAPAMDELCHRPAVPAHLGGDRDPRLPGPVESAGYFVAAKR